MEPYVSFVTWGRNDGYRPDYVRRLGKALHCLAAQLEKAGIESEIILSEWNPPSGRPLLLDSLELGTAYTCVTIKGFVAGPQFHAGFAGQERGMHSGEAWNVGIRRARGRFISPKASDTFFSGEVIDRIARRDLQPDRIYRVDRYDVAMDDSLWHLDGESLVARLDRLPARHNDYLQQLAHWRLRELHTNACGDFLLMGAACWQRLRGHPLDKTTLMLDGDSLVMHAAAAQGMRECRWPAPAKIYKPFHGNLNDARVVPVWRPWQRRLDAVLTRLGSVELAHRARMRFDYPRRRIRGVESVLGPSIERNFVQPASRWTRHAPVVPTQPDNWGLADHPLEERILCRAAWDTGRAQ
jgi:hypothetical protein